jgi:hypothetical protein
VLVGPACDRAVGINIDAATAGARARGRDAHREFGNIGDATQMCGAPAALCERHAASTDPVETMIRS